MSEGPHFVRKRLAAGKIAWYICAWRGGPQVHRSEGLAKPKLTNAVMARIVEAASERVAPAPNTLRSLIRLWKSDDPARPSSPEWSRLAVNTKKVWGSALNKIEDRWGDVPLAVFNDPRAKAAVVAWRDSQADRPRSADIGVTVLNALLKFGMLRGKVLHNAAAGVPTLYRGGNRAEIIWTDDDIERFCAYASRTDVPTVGDALRLAATTGLRREDLVTLKLSEVGDLAILKKAAKSSRGKRRNAHIVRLPDLDRVLLDLQSRQRQPGVETVLVDQRGRPWTPDRLTRAIGQIRDDLGIVHVDPDTGEARKKHLHDARGTFATKLMTATDWSDREIAEMMAWSPEEVTRIRQVYVDQSARVVALAERIRRSV